VYGMAAVAAVDPRASLSQVKYAYFSPWDITLSDTYTDELTNVELGGKDPERAWQDARNRIERLLRRQGVLS
ncbi:ABC transporter substrate-binding protein, partial [Streptomyces niveus]